MVILIPVVVLSASCTQIVTVVRLVSVTSALIPVQVSVALTRYVRF